MNVSRNSFFPNGPPNSSFILTLDYLAFFLSILDFKPITKKTKPINTAPYPNHTNSYNEPPLVKIRASAIRPMPSITIPMAINILFSFFIFSPELESHFPILTFLEVFTLFIKGDLLMTKEDFPLYFSHSTPTHHLIFSACVSPDAYGAASSAG
jgi:hypothetical protein